ncbi:hypothetical protein ACVNF4_30755 [Streptomyces sp. S6]
MPRGRHRHSPPLHRLLPPSAIAGVSLVCAFGPWVFSDTGVLRVVAAIAAAVAIVGAAVLRRWDSQAGKTVADLSRARVSDEWRFEERVAELESDLEESRALRGKLEQRLRAKRTELAGLRNEHAALLRRYATAETERASALEGRRRLELESSAAAGSEPKPALSLSPSSSEGAAESAEADVEAAAVEPGLFSPEGTKLFLRAAEALNRIEKPEGPSEKAPADKGASVKGDAPAKGDVPSGGDSPKGGSPKGGSAESGEPVAEDEAEGKSEAADAQEHAVAGGTGRTDDGADGDSRQGDGAVQARGVLQGTSSALDALARQRGIAGRGTDTEDRTAVEPVHALEPAHPTGIAQQTSASGAIVPRPAGHFAVPTAVAVVPTAQPVRRPSAEGGFDFFGTKQDAELEAVQNEDLADVVGQEALALHKAESEAEFKPADEASRGIGQVVDLTAHDETEVLDLQGLRSAAY